MDKSYSKYSAERRAHWDQIAIQRDTWRSLGVHYHSRLNEIFKKIVPKNSRVLEIGCGKGQLLAYLQPSFGVGIDFSTEMVKRSTKKYPNLHFLVADAHSIPLQNLEFDYIILSDLLNDLWDIQTVLEVIHRLAAPHTRIVINFFSRVWQPVLYTARFLGLATPLQQQNWITIEDTRSLLKLTNLN